MEGETEKYITKEKRIDLRRNKDITSMYTCTAPIQKYC